jgi:hypothetical protein
VADTVGAGDAFTAALALGLLHGWPLDETNRLGQRSRPSSAPGRAEHRNFPQTCAGTTPPAEAQRPACLSRRHERTPLLRTAERARAGARSVAAGRFSPSGVAITRCFFSVPSRSRNAVPVMAPEESDNVPGVCLPSVCKWPLSLPGA